MLYYECGKGEIENSKHKCPQSSQEIIKVPEMYVQDPLPINSNSIIKYEINGKMLEY
ncbi:hypothetical protein Glove_251g45 [Diversispora epigaea]|uniref:Uncharacterized protein n=1 Tax=Diversispora epigaea TaxID=1348612 RepID=A0A397IAK3_9GLOM|nr:hypothetical protein Glove_251g45 [Diversispora epigaea]